MRVAIITNVRDGKGLARDAVILERLLSLWGHEAHIFDFRQVDRRDYSFTVVIYLELVTPKALSWSDKHVLFANPDWMKPEYLYWLPAFRYVLAKTREGERVLKAASVERVVYVGFESEDRMLRSRAVERRFLHSWCSSIQKGTRQVLRAFADLHYPTTFHVGTKVPEAQYRKDQNTCRFWIQPSAVEGYGHCINEGLSVGALVATLDAPPMRESTGLSHLIPARRVSRQNLADCYEAKPEAIAEVAREMWETSDEEIDRLSTAARVGYLDDRERFRERFRDVLEEAL